jgi:putative transposase
MRFTPSILGRLVEPIDRGRFQTIVEAHDGDAYDKSFESWDHLMVLLYAQLSGATSLRNLESGWNAHNQHHYHLGCGELRRSTLSDASRRRPNAVFAQTFELLAGLLDRHMRRDGSAMLRIIDSTPIPLGKLCDWAKFNGRIRGMKMHIVYDPGCDCPRLLGITDANINDAQIGRTAVIETGATYVFDKAYCHYGWWTAITEAGAFLVTRPKSRMRLEVTANRPLGKAQGDGFVVLADQEVSFASKGDSKLDIPLRRIIVERQDGETLELLSNDLERTAADIATLYKARWQIELLFRWIKQHLKIRKFLGNNDNAIRLQLLAAMIAYVLLRIAAQAHRVALPILRFTELVGRCLFDRRDIAQIQRPPPVNPSQRMPKHSPNQMSFSYA